MLSLLRRITPAPVLQFYHYFLARFSALIFGHPSEKLIVIGVTGTNGKSSTVQFIAQLLTILGEKVGYTTTAGFSVAGQAIENQLKMTMPGRFLLQRLLRQMVAAGCRYAIVETSSQGIAQFRHLGINYDVAVFTNLTPEHIESHGSFEAYKQAKGRLFSHLVNSPRKKFAGQMMEKISIINTDDPHADYFASFVPDRLVRFSFEQPNFELVTIPLEADFQKKNVLAAANVLEALGFSHGAVAQAITELKPIAGRFEKVEKGQPFAVIVDYAYEPYALQALYESVARLAPRRIIGVHGSAGGGRDKARRYQIGKLAAEREDIVIVTNEDPYDEDPRAIIEAVARGASENGKIEGQNLFLIDDRAAAIERAIGLAEPGDAVLLTAKGSEQVMAVAHGQKIPWSDRQVALQALAKRGYI